MQAHALEPAGEGIEVRYGLEQLRADWRRLALSSDFLGEATAQARFAQRVVSSAVNELLELVYRLGAGQGSAALAVVHADEQLEIRLTLPLEPEQAGQVQQEVARLREMDARSVYFEQLGQSAALSPLFGMLHLMADYGARIDVDNAEGGLLLRLTLSTAEGASA